MINFPVHADCTLCELHETCKTNRGIPTRLMDEWTGTSHPSGLVTPVPYPPLQKAVLIVGEAPGSNEDKQGKCWTGWSGQTLYRFLTQTYKLHEHVHIYLTNSVRCQPPGNSPPLKSHRTACKKYLLDDITRLAMRYGGNNVYILALGAPAVACLTNKSIRAFLPYQGTRRLPYQAPPGLTHYRIYASYHPSAMAPKRKPEYVHAFDAHLRFLLRDLQGIPHPVPSTEYTHAPSTLPPPADLPFGRVYSLDIETYGVLDTHEQTVFHPQRATTVDGIDPERQVVCASISWFDNSGDQVNSAWYNLYSAKDTMAFVSALNSMPEGVEILGMNIAFDLQFLRARIRGVSQILRRGRVKLRDLAVANHLHSDTRPERSLKSLSHLLSTADYNVLEVSMRENARRARRPSDPGLIAYNVTDTISTLKLYRQMMETLLERWDYSVPGLDRMQYHDDLLWCIVEMSEAGLRFSPDALQKAHDTYVSDLETARADGEACGYRLGGTGSEASVLSLFEECVGGCGPNFANDRRLKFTAVKKQVSTGKGNMILLTMNLPPDSPTRPALDALERYRTAQNLIGSYTKPLLTIPHKGMSPWGHAYPSWFPVPSFTKGNDNDFGGTRQARLAAHNPAAQTMPPPIEHCMVSRYPHGWLFSWDLSQLELRMAATLSGDPGLMASYAQDNVDLHHDTAALIYPGLLRADDDYNPKRQLGKRTNFLTIFRGTAPRLVETARRYMKIELDPEFAYEAIRSYWRGHQGLWNWQETLIDFAVTHGYLEIPTGWRRTFVRSRYLIEETYVNEICNFWIQALSVQVALTIQADILDMRIRTGYDFRIPLQTHDSITIDVCPLHAAAVVREVEAIFDSPRLWHAICDWTGNLVPMNYDRKTVYSPIATLT